MNTIPDFIDQTGVRAMIRERLEHPERYADKPLFIWQAEWHDGIQQKLIVDASLDFNRGKAREDWCYFHMTSVVDENAFLGMPHDKGHLVGNVINPRKLPLDDYLRIVSKLIDENNGELPLIVYMPYRYETLQLSGEQYVFEPDFEDWSKYWFDTTIPDFIRGNGDRESILYRWYYRYRSSDKGCYDPLIWYSVSSTLRLALKAVGKDKANLSICELDEKIIRSAFQTGMHDSNGHISDDIIDAFVKYLKNNG